LGESVDKVAQGEEIETEVYREYSMNSFFLESHLITQSYCIMERKNSEKVIVSSGRPLHPYAILMSCPDVH
jgi:hypothetical protein